MPMCGKIWEIALAFHRAKILPSCSPKVLLNWLKKRVSVKGQWAGRDLYVYVNREKHDEDKIESARRELEKIQSLPYHPTDHSLPRGYRKQQDQPLEASENNLAEVLHEVGILKRPSIADLRKALKTKGRGLFGTITDDEAVFRVYLHDNHGAVLEQARQLLESRKGPA
jgi:hypothetical protein